jgi:phosphate uptake regulator
VFNAITRRLKEVQQHKVLLERKNFIDALISRLQHQQSFQDVEQQIQDLRDSFTTHDSELLEKVNNNVKKLEQSELQIDDTIFLFQTWLLMNQMNTKDSQQTNAKRKPKS